tara:strand:- start:513 stop:815 length:303 start_codon:yes stop_codon:yes gene_type:complete
MDKQTNATIYGECIMNNVFKKEVTKLYQGFLVSIRDYERDKAVKQGGMILIHNKQTMYFSPKALKELKPSTKIFKSKFGKDYRLIDIRWNPSDNSQTKLF